MFGLYTSWCLLNITTRHSEDAYEQVLQHVTM